MLKRCFLITPGQQGIEGRPCYDNTAVPGRLPYATLLLCYRKNTSLKFYVHPVLGGCQNNSTSPDPLSPREGLACETTLTDQNALSVYTAVKEHCRTPVATRTVSPF